MKLLYITFCLFPALTCSASKNGKLQSLILLTHNILLYLLIEIAVTSSKQMSTMVMAMTREIMLSKFTLEQLGTADSAVATNKLLLVVGAVGFTLITSLLLHSESSHSK